MLKSLVAQQDVLESRWGEVEGLCAGAPRTLVHGDFQARNLRVRTGPAGATLVCFDWEMGGWGVPGADLASRRADPDPAAYAAVVRGHWPDVGPETVARLARVGKLFWVLAATDWTACELPNGWPESPMHHLRVYEARQENFLRGLGEA
jgi:hypothetical protein